MNDQRPAMPDEDALDFPKTWLRHVHPRRGGIHVPPVELGEPEAARRLLEDAADRVDALVGEESAHPERSAAARRHLDGDPDPAGAAALASVAAPPRGRRMDAFLAFVDAWTAEHGLVFAAHAALELCRIDFTDGEHIGVRGQRVRPTPDIIAMRVLRRVRALLAEADDAVYAEAAERLDGMRWEDDHAFQAAWMIAYLFPTRQDRIDALLGEGATWGALEKLKRCSLGRPAQLDHCRGRHYREDMPADVLATMLDGLGADLAPWLVHVLEHERVDEAAIGRVLDALAVLPSDAAFRTLLGRWGDREAKPVMLRAMERFPVRALRILAAEGGPATADLLTGHVRANPELVAAALPGLPEKARAVVEPIAASLVRVPEASPAELPEFLTAPPPWKRPVKPVVPGLEPPEPRAAWPAGLHERWRAVDTGEIQRIPDPDWTEIVAGRHGFLGLKQLGNILLYGPEDLAREVLATRRGGFIGGWQKAVVARLGIDAHRQLLGLARNHPDEHDDALLPFLSADVAAFAAEALLARSAAATGAGKWLDHHGTDTVPYLAPAALGKPGKPRQAAEHALRRLAVRHGREAVVAAFPDAPDELQTLLAAHPAQTGLVKPPKIGGWVEQAGLPQVLLRGGDRALPASAVPRLLELLALPVPYALDEIRATFEPASLTGLGWAVFSHWNDSGRPSKESWALTQLGNSGDDEAVRRLAPLIRAWPGEGGHKYAVTGLDVLAGIGSDIALMHLHSISQKVKFKGLRGRAKDKIAEVAEVRGLSLDELADRLVPSFGLDADGSMTLDYGPRRFTVGFDEQLKPVVVDDSGKLRKALPKPGVKDDPALAPAAHKAFAALKKDVRTVAADQLRRLERAMATSRRWTPDEFGAHLVRHPLVGHLVRRLVWLAEEDGDVTAFRIAEDGTFADADDEAFVLPESARIGIAHPIHLGESLKVWAEVFADYEILQPFEQLGRPVHVLTDEEGTHGRLERFERLKVPSGTVLGLEKRGWERAEPGEAGSQEYMSRRVADDRYVVIDLDPGFSIGEPLATGDEQDLVYVWLASAPERFWPSRSVVYPFGELDPVTASEILDDLEMLRAAAI